MLVNAKGGRKGPSIDVIVARANAAGFTVDRSTVARYTSGKVPANPPDETLQALAIGLELDIRELRAAAGRQAGERGSYTPPIEANQMDARQRKAVDELIRAIVSGDPVVMTQEEKDEWDEVRRSGDDISARDWLAERRATMEEHREWLAGGGWRIGVQDDQIRAEAAELGMGVNDYVNGFPETWERYKAYRDSEVTTFVNGLLSMYGGDVQAAMNENNLQMMDGSITPTLFKAAADRLAEAFAQSPRRLRVIRDAQPVEEAADHDDD